MVEEETRRARSFYEELVTLSDEERERRVGRRILFSQIIYSYPFDLMMKRQANGIETEYQTASYILSRYTELRTLTPEEDKEYLELLHKLEEGELSKEERLRLKSLEELGQGERDLLTGNNLDYFATHRHDVAVAALQFFNDWEALPPEGQQQRDKRLDELRDRSMRQFDIERERKKAMETARLRHIMGKIQSLRKLPEEQ